MDVYRGPPHIYERGGVVDTVSQNYKRHLK